MGKPKSTRCRYCLRALGDDNYHGAHLKCFNAKKFFDPSIPGAREAYNKQKAISRRMRQDKVTKEEAEALYDAATGDCECGAEKPRNAKYCKSCALVQIRIRYHMTTKGVTLEEAQAMESAKGTCQYCQKPARYPSGRICDECYKAQDRDAHNGVVRLFDKTCAECNAPFRGSSRAKYCERHSRGVVSGKTRGYSGKNPKAQLPANWDKPAPTKKEKQAPAVERIINPGIEITRIPSMFEDWRATSPDEYDPAKVRAVAEILRRR